MDAERFVFLDETAATTAMTRLYGWAQKGERLVVAAPAVHWKTTTLKAGLRSRGLIAPLVLDGPMTGEVFRAYVEQMLAPSLEPGDVVVMDNLPAHKVAGVREAIQSAQASLLYLPAYSPELNPIGPSLPSSRPSSERLRLGPEILSGTPSGPCSTPSRQRSAPTISRTLDMSPSKSEPLWKEKRLASTGISHVAERRRTTAAAIRLTCTTRSPPNIREHSVPSS
jgi:hypothetical protein